jgi:outer membrane protein assembly factor BamA
VKLYNTKLYLLLSLLFITALASAALYADPSLPQRPYEVSDIEFNFVTTKSFSKDALLEVMFLPKTHIFNQDELEKDRQRIKKFYFDNGFFDALIDTSVSYDSADSEVDISMIIYEKARYSVKEIVLNGLKNIPGNLKEQIGTDNIIKPGDNYMKGNITKETNRILDILQNNGYLNAQLDTSARTEVAKYSNEIQQENSGYKNKVRVTLTFTGTDKIYHFGKTDIKIADNKYKLDKGIIERELKYSEGTVFSKELLIESERNLTKIALIQLGRIQIDTVIESTGAVNLVVNVSLTNKYQITPSIQGKFIDNYFFAGAGLQYDDKNFFGGGRVFSIDVEPLYHSREINRVDVTMNLFQPYLFKDNITGNLKVSAIYYNLNEIFQFLTLSNTLSMNYYLRKHVFYGNLVAQLNADLNREKYKQEFVDDTGRVFTQGTIINSMNSVLGFTATHNNTNNVFNPSTGFYHSFTLEEAGLLPAVLNKISRNIDYSQYFKFYLINYFYFDLTSGLGSKVFGIANRIGSIFEFGRDENIISILPQYKFFSGGGNSLRGWKAQDNGILDNTLDGGKFLFEGSFEYRWMMFPTSKNFLKDIGSVYFIDYGNVWETPGLFKIKENALAVGFGLRYYTFVGPVRVDVGFKLYDPRAADGKRWLFNYSFKDIFTEPRYTIQFGLGNAF